MSLSHSLRGSFSSKAVAVKTANRRASRLIVQAKVDLQGGPRVIRGKCYVTRDVSFCLIKAVEIFLFGIFSQSVDKLLYSFLQSSCN